MNLDENEWKQLISMRLISAEKQKVLYKGQKLKPHLARLVAELEERGTEFVMPDAVNLWIGREQGGRDKALWEELREAEDVRLANYSLVSRNKAVEFKGSRFLLMEWPPHRIGGVESFVEFMRRSEVRVLVRTSFIDHSERCRFLLAASFIRVVDIHFDENGVPSKEKVEEWLALSRMYRNLAGSAVAVHCVNGFGRSPFLVALSLVDLGMGSQDAVSHLRSKVARAISGEQESFLFKYKPKANRRTFPDSCRLL